MIAMPAGRDLHPRVVESILGTTRTLDARGIPFDFCMVCGCSLVQRARNGIVWSFLDSKHNRLLWVDSDQTFTAADVLRLLALSTIVPIVAASYPEKSDALTFAIASRESSLATDKNGLLKVDGLGLGFTMMRREAVAAVASMAKLVKFRGQAIPRPNVFRCDVTPEGDFQGEDIAFFEDCRACGYDVFVDPGMAIGHLGVKEYKGSIKSSTGGK